MTAEEIVCFEQSTRFVLLGWFQSFESRVLVNRKTQLREIETWNAVLCWINAWSFEVSLRRWSKSGWKSLWKWTITQNLHVFHAFPLKTLSTSDDAPSRVFWQQTSRPSAPSARNAPSVLTVTYWIIPTTLFIEVQTKRKCFNVKRN
jgi:hypothetical protein